MSISTIVARFAGVSLAAALLFGPGVAWAQSPHFVGTSTASFTDDSDLAVGFKEAGLGSTPVEITYNVMTTVSGSCACVSKSGNCPSAANKFPPTTVVTPGTFTSGKNGSITAVIITEEPDCQQVSPSTCPNGQTNTLVSLSYADITITDTNNSVSSSVSPTSLTATGLTGCP